MIGDAPSYGAGHEISTLVPPLIDVEGASGVKGFPAAIMYISVGLESPT